jgi:hypothetical protein
MTRFTLSFGILCAALASAGCARQGEVAPNPTPTPLSTPQAAVPEPAVQPAVAQAPLLHYTVRQGDSLWAISARPDVLGDAMQWPLLYRRNRDAIVDPDLIDVGLDLGYARDTDQADVATAEQEAKATPPYVQHLQARKTLAVNY